jgi:CHAT domain-containing protein
LLDERGQYLVKRYRFTYLSSGRDLVRLARQVRGREGPTILAAPHYDDEGPPPAAQLRSRSPFALAGPSFNFSPLPGTQAEAAAVARTLGDARVLTGGQATEKALKTLRGPRLLHLATHGFFLADLPVPLPEGRQRGISRIAPTGGTPGKPDKAAGLAAAEPAPSPVAAAPGWAALADPLLRSGLALAGANRRASGDDDGILTALEAMALDLVGTQLVVLSACETGVGDVRHGDGVYGLRRALVLAGAETQLVTLWRIDDAATQRLIAEYYARIARGVGRSEAMREVSLQMLSNPRTSNPRLWAPFVVSGDPRPLHHHGAGNLQ